jgi:phospholipid/cholesterol/gamma-HCH transport system ATP-binding protein
MIEVKNLHKSFGDTHVLKGITTSFEKGKTNLIIGQSGSGKTGFKTRYGYGFPGQRIV